MAASTHPSSSRIVVGVDGSEHSLLALRHAHQLAEALDRPLVALTSWEWPAIGTEYAPAEWDPESDAQAVLDESVAKVFGAKRPARLSTELVTGPPARALVEASASASMLVVGSRGHGGFAALLLGSVSSACAAHAACPVLVVHAKDAAPSA